MKVMAAISQEPLLFAYRVAAQSRGRLLVQLFNQRALDVQRQTADTIKLLVPSWVPPHTDFYSLNDRAIFWTPLGFHEAEIRVNFGSNYQGIFSARDIGLIATYYALLRISAIDPVMSDPFIENARVIQQFIEQQPNADILMRAID